MKIGEKWVVEINGKSHHEYDYIPIELYDKAKNYNNYPSSYLFIGTIEEIDGDHIRYYHGSRIVTDQSLSLTCPQETMQNNKQMEAFCEF